MFPNLEKHRIDIIGGLILLALTLAAGISVFVVMQRQAETQLSKSLETLLQKAHGGLAFTLYLRFNLASTNSGSSASIVR